jgi:hypothetical protein
MPAEQRRTKRKPMRQTVWLSAGPGAPRTEALLADISDTGARIDVPRAVDLPDSFVLMFTRSGQPCRLCRVAWRASRSIGVRFDKITREEAEETFLRAPAARSG